MPEVNLTDDTFQKEVEDSKIPVLVDFWAAWCGPCQMMAPIIEEIAKEYEGRLKVAKINIDENSKIASKLGVMSIPTLIFFQDGKKKDQLVGYRDLDSLKKSIDAFLLS